MARAVFIMITSRNDIIELLKDFVLAGEYFSNAFFSDDTKYTKIIVNYSNGPVLGKIREKDQATLKFLKYGVTDEALKKELRLYYQRVINKLAKIKNLDIIKRKELQSSKEFIENLPNIKLNDYVEKYLPWNVFSQENMNLSINEKRVVVFLFVTYENYLNELDNKYNSDLSRLNKALIDIINKESQFLKYGLVHINSDRELIVLDPPRIYDKKTHATYLIKNISFNLLNELNKLKNNNLIRDLSVRLENVPSFPGRNDLCKLYEELEWGQYLNLNNLDKITVTKLYSENINDTLWIKIDKQNITFEEICDNFDVYANAIVTQVIHLEYIKEDNEFFITHLDHEYIFYTEDEYLKRESDINQKGTAKPRMKSFKIDNARIPLNYKVEIKRRDVDNVSWIVQTEPFLLYVLDCYFYHKDLLNEYFQNINKRK